MINIDYYISADYKAVVEVLREAELFDKVWESKDNLARKIDKDPQSIIVVKDGKKIVGCVFLVEDGWNAFVWRLAVIKKYRGRNIGKKLMMRVEEIARERSIAETSLFVASGNDSLINWYKSQGYKPTKDYTFLYKRLMEKR